MEIMFEKCLRQLLMKRGKTQNELAKYLFISTQVVSKWCRDEALVLGERILILMTASTASTPSMRYKDTKHSRGYIFSVEMTNRTRMST